MSQNTKNSRSSGGSGWRTVAVCILVIVVPWALYVNVPMRRNSGLPPGLLDQIESAALRKKIEGEIMMIYTYIYIIREYIKK